MTPSKPPVVVMKFRLPPVISQRITPWSINGRHRCRQVRRLATATSAPSALKGIRVLDMTRVLAGPFCTQILGDLGADVIKVEHPQRGDDTRAWGPPYAKHIRGDQQGGLGESAYFLSANRNKRSLGVSYATPEGQSILHKLVKDADILVENYLPGTLKKYNMGYEKLAEINPSLIYASITGYGQTGPWSSRAGYDVMVEAELGLMHITGTRDGPPVKVGVAVTDLTTGLYATNAILASLLARSSSVSVEHPKGLGTHIDACLADSQVAMLTNIATGALVSGKPDSGRWGTEHPSIVPYAAFPCKPSSSESSEDASKKGPAKATSDQILFGGGNDRLFAILCDGLSHPEWATDARFSNNTGRVTNRAELTALISAETSKHTLSHWLNVFEHSGLPTAAVNDIQTTLKHPVVQGRGMVGEVEHDACGPMRYISSPVVYTSADAEKDEHGTSKGSRPSVRRAPPTLGQHTNEILKRSPPHDDKSWGLEMDEEEITTLKEKGVIS